MILFYINAPAAAAVISLPDFNCTSYTVPLLAGVILFAAFICLLCLYFKFKNNILHLVEIKGDDVSSKVIIDGKTQKMAMISMVYANSDHLIIVGFSKTVDIDKITIE